MKLQPAIEEYIAFRKSLGARFTTYQGRVSKMMIANV